MKTNLKWIEQEWRRWLDSEAGKRVILCEKDEHTAKLFAAFCIERLALENQERE